MSASHLTMQFSQKKQPRTACTSPGVAMMLMASSVSSDERTSALRMPLAISSRLMPARCSDSQRPMHLPHDRHFSKVSL